jgi:hypothetical protein
VGLLTAIFGHKPSPNKHDEEFFRVEKVFALVVMQTAAMPRTSWKELYQLMLAVALRYPTNPDAANVVLAHMRQEVVQGEKVGLALVCYSILITEGLLEHIHANVLAEMERLFEKRGATKAQASGKCYTADDFVAAFQALKSATKINPLLSGNSLASILDQWTMSG